MQVYSSTVSLLTMLLIVQMIEMVMLVMRKKMIIV